MAPFLALCRALFAGSMNGGNIIKQLCRLKQSITSKPAQVLNTAFTSRSCGGLSKKVQSITSCLKPLRPVQRSWATGTRLFSGSYHSVGINLPTAYLFAGGTVLVAFGAANLWERQRHKHTSSRFLARLCHDNPLLRRLDTVTVTEKVVAALVGVNLAVFGCWKLARFSPRLLYFMQRNFVHDISFGKPRTMLLSCFSHKDAMHLFINMYALVSCASLGNHLFGPERFAALYVSSGVLGSLGHHYTQLYRFAAPGLGASASVLGLYSAMAVVAPTMQVAIVFLPVAMPLWKAIAGLTCLDMWGLVRGWRALGHGAHLAGTASGAMFGALVRYRNRRSRAWPGEGSQ